MGAVMVTPPRGALAIKEIDLPPSKSLMHRWLIGWKLAGGEKPVLGNVLSEDLRATVNGMDLFCSGGIRDSRRKTFDCGDSGSTLRFLLPMLAIHAEQTRITGSDQLASRPFEVHHKLLSDQGFELIYEQKPGKIPVVMTGQLHSGTFTLPGNISSQFISGLLLALPLLEGPSRIQLSTPMESAPYVEMTLGVLNSFGIRIRKEQNAFEIPGEQRYHCPTPPFQMEGDFSHAAFWLTLGCLMPQASGGISVGFLSDRHLQGDEAVISFLKAMGGELEKTEHGWLSVPSGLSGIEIDLSQCPDLLPPLAVAALGAKGITTFTGGRRLRYKESDRLEAMAALIRSIGGQVETTSEGLRIFGGQTLSGGKVKTFGDHRIAMAAAVASVLCKTPVVIDDGTCVKKSYPSFWKTWCEIGGKVHGINMGQSD